MEEKGIGTRKERKRRWKALWPMWIMIARFIKLMV
jgi:hypothetical protein